MRATMPSSTNTCAAARACQRDVEWQSARLREANNAPTAEYDVDRAFATLRARMPRKGNCVVKACGIELAAIAARRVAVAATRCWLGAGGAGGFDRRPGRRARVGLEQIGLQCARFRRFDSYHALGPAGCGHGTGKTRRRLRAADPGCRMRRVLLASGTVSSTAPRPPTHIFSALRRNAPSRRCNRWRGEHSVLLVQSLTLSSEAKDAH